MPVLAFHPRLPMRLPLACIAPVLLAVACGGSSGNNLSSNPSIVGGWTNIDGSLLEFKNSGSCAADIVKGTTSLLCGDCTYATSGSSLTLTVHTSLDGGPAQDVTCDCSFQLSNNGNALQVTSTASATCPSFSAMFTRQSGNSSFFCSGG